MIDKKELEIRALEKHVDANPDSPLFAKLASLYLERGKAQDALEVCDRGLAHHPLYTTAHLVKGKALLTLEMTSEARRELELVHQYQPLVESVKNLLNEIGPSPDELKIKDRIPASDQPEPSPAKPEIVVSNSAPKVVKAKPTFARPAPEPVKPQPEIAKPKSEPVEPEPPIEAAKLAREVPKPPIVVESPPVVQSPPEPPKPEPEELPPLKEEDKELEELAIEELESEGAFGDLQTDELLEEKKPDVPVAEAEPVMTPADSFTVKTAEIVSNQPIDSDDPFGIGETASAVPEVEEKQDDASRSFEEFSTRTREDLGATENTLTLDDYFTSPEIEAPKEPEMTSVEPQEPEAKNVEPEELEVHEVTTEEPAPEEPKTEETVEKNEIEDIAKKLKTAKKITPVINLADRSASASEEPRGATGFVTPTLAEIYAKQGWYDDAIRAYRQLSISKPADKEKFMKRIEELEAEKKRSG